MKKKSKLIVFAIIMLFMSSCAKHIYVNYQLESANTGKVILKPTKPTTKTYVTFNDNLIVNKKKVKSVTVNNVPIGEHKIHYTSDNFWYKDKLDSQLELKIENNKEITKLIEVPPYSTGYWIYVATSVSLPWLFILATL